MPQTLVCDENEIATILRKAYTKGGEDMLPVTEDVGIQFSEFVAKGIHNKDFGFIPEWKEWRMWNVQQMTGNPTNWTSQQLYQHFLTTVYKPKE